MKNQLLSRKRIVTTAAAAFAAAALTLSGNVPVAQAAAPSDNAVFVGGTMIMRVRVAGGGYSPEQRAAQIQERVNLMVGRGPIRASDIVVQARGSEAVVLAKGDLLFTADWATARFNRTTPYLLAEQWAARMQEVLPGLTQPK